MLKNSFSIVTIVILPIMLWLTTGTTSATLPVKDSKAESVINNDKIKSVQFFREGWEFSMPVIELGSDQRLLLKFDDLSPDTRNYYYTIAHCDADWNPSRLVPQEYMEGFPDNPINDYAFSINTTLPYINYQLVLPNEEARLLISGNYLLSVWEGNKRQTPVLTRRFYVVEPKVGIAGEVKKATFDGFRGPDQEVDFVINHPNISIRDPRNEVKVVVMQNSQTDNCITNLKPLFIRQNQLDYNYNKENVFAGGNEFRNFDTKNLRINGRGVQEIQYLDPYYQVRLFPDRITREETYRVGDDLNGHYLVKNDRAEDADLESDYMLVRFSLETPTLFTGGEIYVFGALSDWRCTPSNRMKHNPESKLYEATLLLKQGFYDYRYVYIEKDSQVINHTLFEGSHVETENDYHLLVYYRDFSSRYDKLIGYRTINSVNR